MMDLLWPKRDRLQPCRSDTPEWPACWQYSLNSKGRDSCGNERGLAYPRQAERPGLGHLPPQPYILLKSGNYTVRALANPRSRAVFQIGRTSVRRILGVKSARPNRDPDREESHP